MEDQWSASSIHADRLIKFQWFVLHAKIQKIARSLFGWTGLFIRQLLGGIVHQEARGLWNLSVDWPLKWIAILIQWWMACASSLLLPVCSNPGLLQLKDKTGKSFTGPRFLSAIIQEDRCSRRSLAACDCAISETSIISSIIAQSRSLFRYFVHEWLHHLKKLWDPGSFEPTGRWLCTCRVKERWSSF